MRITTQFKKDEFLRIAKTTGNQQIVKDVNYMQFLNYHKCKLHTELIDGVCFFGGNDCKDYFKLICICVDKQHQGKGYARFMLQRAKEYAKSKGYTRLTTRTKNAVDFYIKFANAKIVDMKGEDYILEFFV